MDNDYRFGCFFQIVFTSAIMGFAITEDIYGVIFGLLFGLLICYIFGTITKKWESEGDSGYLKKINNKVLEAITKLSMLVMKADEYITNSELYAFRDYMLNNFGTAAAADAIELMKYLQYQKISSSKAASVINSKLNYAEKMQILQFLFQLAASDGELHASESDILNQIAEDLQILQTDFIYLKNAYNYMYNRRYSQQDSSNQSSSYIRKNDPQESDYAVLGVKSTDSNEEIKAAYRRLAIANHPDKVLHLGETAHKEAEKRFSQINEAYNRIKKARKI